MWVSERLEDLVVIARLSAPDVAAGRRGIYKLGQLYYGESKREGLEEE